MKYINLANAKESDIKYEIVKYPDGQQNVILKPEYKDSEVTIESRFNSWLDLELIACTVLALRRESMTDKIHLDIPYLLGARSDRKFGYGQCSYLRDVIAPAINALNFASVRVLDPHNPAVTDACINNLVNVWNTDLIAWAIDKIPNLVFHEMILIAPDKGAVGKLYDVAKAIGFKGTVMVCDKIRDIATGKITHIEVKREKVVDDASMIIIDDICDGGGTFIGIAKQLKEMGYTNKLYLIVTHGIFSKGFDELKRCFDGIYCTNSYSDLGTAYMGENGHIIGNKLKQMKVI